MSPSGKQVITHHSELISTKTPHLIDLTNYYRNHHMKPLDDNLLMLSEYKIINYDYNGHNQYLLKTRDDENSEMEA